MTRALERYVARRGLPPLVLFVCLSWLLVWLSQGLRLGSQLSAALAMPSALLTIALSSLPTIAAVTLPYALVAAIALCCLRLRANAELEAMEALGFNPIRAFRGLGLVVLVTIVVGYGLLAAGERTALQRLRSALQAVAARSLITQLEPGRFNSVGGGVSLYLRERRQTGRDQHQLSRIVLAIERPTRVLVARRASVELTASALLLELAEGQGQLLDAAGAPIQLRFGSLSFPLSLTGAIDRQLGFLGRIAAPWRAPGLALTCISFAAMALWAFLRRRFQPALVQVVVLVALHEAVVWALGLRWPAGQGRVAVALIAALAVLVRFTLQARRGSLSSSERGQARQLCHGFTLSR